MDVRCKLIPAVISLALACGSAHADFESQYADWQAMSDNARAYYVQGLFDGEQNSAALGEPNWVTALRSGLSECATAQHLTAVLIGQAMTRHYETYAADWQFSPAMIYSRTLNEICMTYINNKRRVVGLNDWETPSGSISSVLNRGK